MNKRPQINISHSPLDKIIEGLSIVALVAMWAVTIWNFGSLPEQIPIHFNFSGEADRHATKYMIFLLPIVGAILFFFLMLLTRYPSSYNYPVEITEENAEFQYKNAVRMMRFVNFSIVFVFAILTYRIIRISIGRADSLNMDIILMLLALIFLPLVYFIFRSYQKR